ncbi:MAG: TetR/AcrR family transcriptional regulator [Lachnospiraceae bacterium]|nr:TetR/AcrR family transcriptional regulator [Lachnospiraceae bacterium]
MLNKKNQDLFLRRKRAFVDAASTLIDSQPFGSISIRKIAETAGFHNSTIYSYFQDSDWLISLASVRFLQPYSDALVEISRQNLCPYEYFYAIWNCFCRYAFSNPALYYNFFFGKYKYQLTELLDEYYTLFPDIKNNHSPLINTMFQGNNMYDRCLSILTPLVNEAGARLTDENLEMANFIIVSTLEEYLSNQIREEGTPSDESYADISIAGGALEDYRKPTAEFLKMLHFIVDN